MAVVKKIVIVGAGDVADSMHIPAWNKLSNTKIVGVVDVNQKAANKLMQKWNIPSSYTNLDDLVKENKPDIIDICTPPSTHYSLAKEAFKAECHVVLEKPMADTVEDAKKILDLATENQKKGKYLGVLHTWLFDKPIVKIINEIEKGKLGEILHVDSQTFVAGFDHMLADPNHWCHKMPGGRFGENLIHRVYLLHKILGNLNIKSLQFNKRGNREWVKSVNFCS